MTDNLKIPKDSALSSLYYKTPNELVGNPSYRTGHNVTRFVDLVTNFKSYNLIKKIIGNLYIFLVFFPYVIVYFIQCIIFLVQYS
jgi:hypothetical protein